MRALDELLKLQTESGLYPTLIHNLKSSLSFANNDISIGAMGDSFYEYLLKIWLQVSIIIAIYYAYPIWIILPKASLAPLFNN